MKEQEVQLLQRELELVRSYRENPILAANDLLNVDLAVPQQKVLLDMWFKSRVVFCGGRGSGKSFLDALFACLWAMLWPGQKVGLLAPSFRQCVVGETLVNTEYGLQYVADLKEKPGSLLSSSGMASCSAFFRNDAAPTIMVSTLRGYKIEGAIDHRILVLDTNGCFDYKTLSSLDNNDYLCLKKESLIFGDQVDLSPYIGDFVKKGNSRDCRIPETLDESLSYFIGLLSGDGCLTQENYILFTNADQDIVNSYKEISSKYFDSILVEQRENDKVQITKGNKKFYEFLCNIGIGGKYAHEKTTPSIILKSTKSNVISFIRGLFDTDGGAYYYEDSSHKYKVAIALTSEQLVDEIQVLLLGLGIVGSRSINVSGRKKPLHTLEISDKQSIIFFREKIGFISSAKSAKLDEAYYCIMQSDIERTHSDIIPNINKQASQICSMIRDTKKGFGQLRLWLRFDKDHNVKVGLTRGYVKKLLSHCREYNLLSPEVDQLNNILEANFIFDRIETKKHGFDTTYDFTVDVIHDYFSNGFISHNSKIMFSEVDKIWSISPLLQECTSKSPITASDRCYLPFMQSGNANPSIIEAVPLGDGGKIRGARYHVIIADEFAQIPVNIFNAVIKPMGATSASPMEKVRRLALIDALIKSGKAKREDFEVEGSNKIIVSSSAFFQFNHMYETINTYQKQIAAGDKNYAVHHVSYRDMPKGFLDENNIRDARLTMPRIQFRMEYEAIWEADSAGVFKASLVEECKKLASFTIKIKEEPGKQYIIGVDPARSSDGYALVVLEMGIAGQTPVNPHKIVAAWEFYQLPFPQMADFIIETCRIYKNVIAVHMDAGAAGGGLAVKDLLAEEKRYGSSRILDAGDETTEGLNGRRILYMFYPAPQSNAEAVYGTLNLMEQKMMAFPEVPLQGDEGVQGSLEVKEQVHEVVEKMLSQLMLIEVTESKSGVPHFDVPEGGGHGAQKKDLYSAFVLAAKKAYDLQIAVDTSLPMADLGIIENILLPTLPERNLLASSMEVINAPISSWTHRKTFKPSGT